MNAYCLSVAICKSTASFLSNKTSSTCIKSPIEYNCCYHTSILQFYSALNSFQIQSKLLLEPIRLRKIAQALHKWDKNEKEIGSFYTEKYSELFNTFGFNYKNCEVVHQIANEFLNFSAIQESIVHKMSKPTDPEHDSVRYNFIETFPERAKDQRIKHHTTLGFFPNRHDVNLDPLSKVLKAKDNHIGIFHDKLILSKVNHLCMTPKNSIILAYI